MSDKKTKIGSGFAVSPPELKNAITTDELLTLTSIIAKAWGGGVKIRLTYYD